MRGLLLAATLLPAALGAQTVQVRGDGRGAAIVREVAARPHVVRAGAGPLVLPRDSTVSTSVLVVGRPLYLASRVNGDVIVVGGDLYLRPGVEVSGRAVAIGGTVASTSLGRVAGGVESMQGATVAVAREDGGGSYDVEVHDPPRAPGVRLVELSGIYGIRVPSYDRVNGLSLPVGVTVTLPDSAVVAEPTVTYRSRLGAFDPGVTLRIAPTRAVRLEGRVARDTRTNDGWIYPDLVNSAGAFFGGTDTRNWFRSDLAEGRLLAVHSGGGDTLRAFVGGRREKVSPITAAGNVWSVTRRRSEEGMRRPNPTVEPGDIGSLLFGGELRATSGVVQGRLRADAEQGLSTPAGTSRFFQVTMDGRVDFPTVAQQALHVHARAVATSGDSVPLARYAYLGGSGTLRTLDLLEQGGPKLLFVENRYTIPIPGVQLPLVGSPVFTLRDAFGAAGVDSLPSLQHEIGAGVGLNWVRLDVTHAVAGKRGTEVGIGVSLTR